MRFASWTVWSRDTGRAAPRSARGGCDAGALAFSTTCVGGRPTRGAAGLATDCAVLEEGPDLADSAEAGRDVPDGACFDPAATLPAAWEAGRGAGGGAWP